MDNKAVIFDLDGTLIDSLEDLADSANDALKFFGFEKHDNEAYKYFIGDGIRVLFHRATNLPLDDEKIPLLHAKFNEIYKEKVDTKTKVYDGIYDLLEKLEKDSYKTAILSNKQDHFTKDCINKFFNKYSFVSVNGQKKEVPKKPHPQAALMIAEELKSNPKDIFFVGDTKVDMQTAVNSGMIGIGVLWGFRDEKELKDNGATFIVNHPSELYEILTGDKYVPIACSFYDRLEETAMRKQSNTIVYLQNKEIKTIEDIIVDFKTSNKEEFALLKSGLKIRLDKIIKINDFEPKGNACSV